MSEKSVIQKVYDHLSKNGFEVHWPGYKKGDCKSKYIVLKSDGVFVPLVVSSERPIYTIMCYVPHSQYSQLIPFTEEVKECMRGIFPLVMYEGNETPSYYDEAVKADMISFQYYGCRRIVRKNL